MLSSSGNESPIHTTFWCFLGGRGSIGLIFAALLVALAAGIELVVARAGDEALRFETMVAGPLAICCAGYAAAGLLRLRRVSATTSEVWLEGPWGRDRIFRALGVASRLIAAGSSVYLLHCAGGASPRDRARQIEAQAPPPGGGELRCAPRPATCDSGELRGAAYPLQMALVAVGALLLTLWLAVPVQPDGRFWGAYLAEVLGSAHGGARVPPALRLLFASGTCAMSLLVFRTVLVAMMRARRPPLRGVGRFLMLEDPPELRLDVEVRRGYGGAKARGCCCLVALVGVLLVAAASPLLLMRGIATLEALVLLWLAYRLARHVATLCSRARWLEVDSHGARLMLDGQWHDVTNCESDGERAVMHVGLLSVWLSLPRLTPLQRPAGVGPLVQLVRGLLVGKEGGQS